ncbi:hypothetical protein NXS19_005731 [Fusarium pseudograminearum]|nr:hypothetical protein NXS19_005731 [Fusarium pseudograminearum]
MLLSTATHRKYAYTLLAAVVIVVLLAGNYAYNGHISPNTAPKEPEPTSATTLKTEAFPHKIWQSWKDDSEDPTERTVGFPHQWRVVNPGWRYERITDANNDAYVLDRFDADISDVFTSLKDPILKADFLRSSSCCAKVVYGQISTFIHTSLSQNGYPSNIKAQ